MELSSNSIPLISSFFQPVKANRESYRDAHLFARI